MTISALITAIWPVTDSKLAADTTIDYATAKTNAIARAKRSLYGTADIPPDEGDIGERARDWIADKATLFLIPVARDWYMNNTRQSDSKENASISYYDRLAALNQLEAELKASVNENLEDALDDIDASDAPESLDVTPAVSVEGLLFDPTGRAYYRGPY